MLDRDVLDRDVLDRDVLDTIEREIDQEGGSRHAVAALDGVTGVRVDWADSKGPQRVGAQGRLSCLRNGANSDTASARLIDTGRPFTLEVCARRIIRQRNSKRTKMEPAAGSLVVRLGGLVSKAQVVTIVISVLVPIATAAAGILGVMFQDWQVQKSQAGRRKLALEDASKQVSFATDWWNAKKLLADSPEAVEEATSRAASWLEEASARVAGSKLPTDREKHPVTLRRLLLFYPLQGRGANIIRGLFFASLGLLLWGVGSTITDALDSKSVTDDLIDLIVMALITLSLRFWAVSAENPKTGTRTERPGTLRRALLFYRLHRGASSLVRIMFYAWVGFIVWLATRAVVDVQEDTNRLAEDITLFIALIGWAVGLRYWAASMGTRPDADEADDQLTAETTFYAAKGPSTQYKWPPVPNRQPDQNNP